MAPYVATVVALVSVDFIIVSCTQRRIKGVATEAVANEAFAE